MDPVQARQQQLQPQSSRPISRMSSTRTAYKIRGNRDPSLPIEDWAKGISRAFSRRKKTVTGKSVIVELPVQEDVIASIPLTHRQSYTSSTWTASSEGHSEARVYPESPDHISSGPTEKWIRETSLERPVLQPRSPRRASLFIESTIYQAPQVIPEHDVLTPLSSRSSGSIADWHSDTNTDQSIHDLVYQNQTNEPVELPSEVYMKPVSHPQRKSSLPKTYPRAELDSTNTAGNTEEMSLRTLFFGGSQASRERRRSLSIASSHFSVRPRALSRASSMMTFTTAFEHQFENKSDIQLGNPFHEGCVSDEQISSIVGTTISKDDCSMRSTSISEDGTDEDCSVYDDDATFDDVIRSYNAAAEGSKTETSSPETISKEEPAFEHCVPGDGSLADILFQVASSSPYGDSDAASEDASSIGNTSASDRVEVSSQSSFEEDISSRRSSNGSDLGKTSISADCQSISVLSSTASTYDHCRPRVPRQYRLINGSLVAFEPWRSAGQSDLSRYTLS